MKLCRPLVLAAALLLGLAALTAQTPLPTDPTIRTGTLASGLQYFLVTSAVQRDRVFVQLAVKAGSIDEADDQRGVAHLLEHMAFNGSTHFTPGEMMAFFRPVGAPIGAHINAATAYDSTMYFMDVPVAQDAAVRRAFEALRDVTDGLTLDATELVRERRVVTEEWRLRLGAAERLRQPMDLAVLGGSKYADRPVLGDIDRLATMPIEQVRRFYRDHYHPDRMALIVVGGLPTADMEARVHETFDTLAANPSPPRTVPESPRHTETRYAAFSDPEVRGSAVGVSFVQPRSPVRTADDLRGELLRILAGSLMDVRLSTLARQAGAPFHTANVRQTVPLLNTSVVSFTATIDNGNAPRALSVLLQEIARAREHGFTDAEIAQARTGAMAGLGVIGRNNQSIAAILLGEFLRGEPTPSPTQRVSAALPFLARLTNDDVREAIRIGWSDSNRIVTSSAAAGLDGAPATEAMLRQAVKVADAAAVPPPWQPPAAVTAARTTLPPPGTVMRRSTDQPTGITVLTLSNGVQVWLKPLLGDRNALVPPVSATPIRFAVIASGGSSLAPPGERAQMQLAAQLVAAAGVGGLPAEQRAQSLQGHVVQIQPFLTPTGSGMNGGTRLPDLDAALNLVHLHFTAPNDVAPVVERVKATARAQVQARTSDPAAVFQSRVTRINTSDFAPLREASAGDIDAADATAAMRFYRERFSNAADFTFFFAGPFSVETITPLLEKYVGSLPSAGAARAAAPLSTPSFPASVVRDTVRKGKEPRSQVTLTFFAPTGHDPVREELARAVAAILRTRVYDRLRGAMGATYTVSAIASRPTTADSGTIKVDFVCAPANVEALTQAAIAEATRLARNGPTVEEVASTRAARVDELKTQLSQASYWISLMEEAHFADREAASIPADPAATVVPLTVDALKDAARKYLPESRYTVVTLLPEVQ